MQLPLTKLPIHVYIFINQQSIFNKYLSQIIYPRYIFINQQSISNKYLSTRHNYPIE